MLAVYHADRKHAHWAAPLCPTCVAPGDSQVIILADNSATIRNVPDVFAVAMSLGRSVSNRAWQWEEWGWVVDVLGRLASEQEDLQAQSLPSLSEYLGNQETITLSVVWSLWEFASEKSWLWKQENLFILMSAWVFD